MSGSTAILYLSALILSLSKDQGPRARRNPRSFDKLRMKIFRDAGAF
jgi:hypothetical protein